MCSSARGQLRAPLELGRHDQNSPDDRDQPDVEEGLDCDLVRADDEAKRVEELADDQRQQNAVEHQYRDVDRAIVMADAARRGD